MCNVPDTTGFSGYGSAPGETGDFATPAERKDYYKKLITKANNVSLIHVFKHYGLNLNETNRKIVCPFLSHKNGKENSASFNYFPNTNSFWCYGCGTGSHGCDIVSIIDNISRAKAAHNILKWFDEEIDDEIILKENYSERLEIMMEFSSVVMNFRQSTFTEEDFLFIEHACSVYDLMHIKHETLDNTALRRMVEKIKEKIGAYLLCK